MGSNARSRRRLRWAFPLGLILAGAGLYGLWPHIAGDRGQEVERLVALLQLSPGMTVAEVGAGNGQMTVVIAQRLGPASRVWSTEIEDKKVSRIEQAAARAGVGNVTVIRASEKSINLPESCCDGIFLRRVYHHFTAIEPLNADLFRAVRPSGRLAVIDFAPDGLMFWLWRPEGVPKNRGGHGVPPALVIEELNRAGFVLERQVDDWPARDYCVVFRKPPPS